MVEIEQELDPQWAGTDMKFWSHRRGEGIIGRGDKKAQRSRVFQVHLYHKLTNSTLRWHRKPKVGRGIDPPKPNHSDSDQFTTQCCDSPPPHRPPVQPHADHRRRHPLQHVLLRIPAALRPLPLGAPLLPGAGPTNPARHMSRPDTQHVGSRIKNP